MTAATVLEVRDVDLKRRDRGAIAKKLGDVLSGSYELLIASQLVHWNAKGDLFLPVHQLTEKHYGELFEALDVIAERMRALGSEVPAAGGNKEFSTSAKLRSVDIRDMVMQLAEMHETCARKAREIAKAAEEADDIVTNDMLVDCIRFHEKAVWMLRVIVS